MTAEAVGTLPIKSWADCRIQFQQLATHRIVLSGDPPAVDLGGLSSDSILEGGPLKTFEEFGLIAPLQRALTEARYQTPTPIQAKTVPVAMLGRDVLGCAQTGTGKTAAFALPILNRLGQQNRKAEPRCPLSLVLAPTRELAIQIEASFATYGRNLHLRCALVYGGVSQARQVKALNRGAHILVATPGRLLDLMNQGHVALHQTAVFALDEVDRMLDMGFLPDLKRIVAQLPTPRQSLFFSATLPPKIAEFAQRLLRSPVKVDVTPESPSVRTIQQHVLLVANHEKRALLRQVLVSAEVQRALVFAQTKRSANALAEMLNCGGIKATAIHGNKSQSARERALSAFRRQEVQVLVATDVAARGIDIDGITHVVNFDLPQEPDSYVHRIGRTGRAGGKGIALSFCTAGERRELRQIEAFIGKKLPISTRPWETGLLPLSTEAGRQPPASDQSGSRGGSSAGTSTVQPRTKPKRPRPRRVSGGRGRKTSPQS